MFNFLSKAVSAVTKVAQDVGTDVSTATAVLTHPLAQATTQILSSPVVQQAAQLYAKGNSITNLPYVGKYLPKSLNQYNPYDLVAKQIASYGPKSSTTSKSSTSTRRYSRSRRRKDYSRDYNDYDTWSHW